MVHQEKMRVDQEKWWLHATLASFRIKTGVFAREYQEVVESFREDSEMLRDAFHLGTRPWCFHQAASHYCIWRNVEVFKSDPWPGELFKQELQMMVPKATEPSRSPFRNGDIIDMANGFWRAMNGCKFQAGEFWPQFHPTIQIHHMTSPINTFDTRIT